MPKVDLPPAPNSASRVLTYEPKTDEAVWEGATVKRGDRFRSDLRRMLVAERANVSGGVVNDAGRKRRRFRYRCFEGTERSGTCQCFRRVWSKTPSRKRRRFRYRWLRRRRRRSGTCQRSGGVVNDAGRKRRRFRYGFWL